MSSKLRFRARGTALVQNFERLEAGIKSFVGRKFEEVQTDDGPRMAFKPTDEADEVQYCAEYVKACKAGDLWPADEATANACGVSFDPMFGASKPEPKAAESKPSKSDKSA